MEVDTAVGACSFYGQQVRLAADDYYTLMGLSQVRSRQLLQQGDVVLSVDDLRQLHDFTQGNPRLLHLYISLCRRDGGVMDVSQLAQSSGLRPWLDQLWFRLPSTERDMLLSLSVFRSPVPRTAWPTEQMVLSRLGEIGLLQLDRAGGVALLPAFRQLLYEELLRSSGGFIISKRPRCGLVGVSLRRRLIIIR